MHALAEGDRGAFDGAFRTLEPLVVRFVSRLVPDRDARDEVVQSTFVRAFEHISEYDHTRDPVTWVLGIAAWQVRSFRRDASRQRARAVDGALDGLAGTTDVEREIASKEERDALIACLEDLPPSDRATLMAVLDDERPPVPTSTFRKRVERAMRRFKAMFKERYGQDRI